MKAYIWVIGLGALFVLARWIWNRMEQRKVHAAHAVRKQGSAQSRAERDRKDVEALTRGIVEPARIPGTETAGSGAAREERGRRAAAHSSFDPDLPPRSPAGEEKS